MGDSKDHRQLPRAGLVRCRGYDLLDESDFEELLEDSDLLELDSLLVDPPPVRFDGPE